MREKGKKPRERGESEERDMRGRGHMLVYRVFSVLEMKVLYVQLFCVAIGHKWFPASASNRYQTHILGNLHIKS